MRVISKRRLREFWESRKSDAAIAKRDFTTWYKITKNAGWAHFAGLRQTFGSADQVGNCVVFDVGNNRFRLIGRVNYQKGVVYVLRVMDHQEYDKNQWAEDCGCYKPPPKKSVKEKPAKEDKKPPKNRR